MAIVYLFCETLHLKRARRHTFVFLDTWYSQKGTVLIKTGWLRWLLTLEVSIFVFHTSLADSAKGELQLACEVQAVKEKL